VTATPSREDEITTLTLAVSNKAVKDFSEFFNLTLMFGVIQNKASQQRVELRWRATRALLRDARQGGEQRAFRAAFFLRCRGNPIPANRRGRALSLPSSDKAINSGVICTYGNKGVCYG